MLKPFLIFPLFFLAIHASGKFAVLNFPASLDFKGDEKLDTSNVGDVIAASLGYYVDSESKWGGLYIRDPFSVPKAAFTILVDGVSEIHLGDKTKTYNLVGNSDVDSMNMVASTAEAANSVVVDMDLNQGPEALHTYSDILGNIQVPKENKKDITDLKPNLHSEDKHFLQEIATLNSISEQVHGFIRLPNLFILRISLNPISSAHGEISPAFTEALKMLSDSIWKLSKTVETIYGDDILFVVATTKDDPNVRTKRQAQLSGNDEQKARSTPNKEDLNLATDYNEDYPVIFNIILWFGVVFAFALLAVSYTIAAMDPGRDSIIYRMTSTRMKKDN